MKTRIRYKKLFFFLLLLAAVCAGIIWGLLSLLTWFQSMNGTAGDKGAASSEYYLLIGTGGEQQNQADSLVLAALNRDKKLFYAISLPGNTFINRTDEPFILLRDTYTNGGAEKTVSAVENLLHIRIDRYAVFNQKSFSSLTGRFRGVDLYVERNMEHTDSSGVPDISLRQGFQSLSGDSSYEYLRFIEPEEGEIGRIQREERFFKALLAQMRNAPKLYSWGLVRYGWDMPDTNLSAGEAASAVYDVLSFPAENLHFVILPGESRIYENQRVWETNPVEIQKVVGLTIDQ